MKKLIRSTVVLLLPLCPFLAHATENDADFYGRINLSMQHENSSDNGSNIGSTTQAYNGYRLESNDSYFGVKGLLNLDNNLKGVYQIEFSYGADDGQLNPSGNEVQTLVARDVFAGLQSDDWGRVIAGKFETPFRQASDNVSPFPTDSYMWADVGYTVSQQVRAGNIVMYTAPKMDDVTVNVALIPGEETGKGPNQGNNGIADGISASAVYDNKAAYLALAVDSDVTDGSVPNNTPGTNNVDGINKDGLRLVGNFKVTDDLTLGALLQAGRNVTPSIDGKADERGAVLSATYAMGSNTLKFQGGKSTTQVNFPEDVKRTSLTIAVDHALDSAKNAKVYGYYTRLQIDNNTGLTGYNNFPQTADTSRNTIGIGFEEKFQIGL